MRTNEDLQKVSTLLDELRKWPSISNKNANRLCINLLSRPESEIVRFCGIMLKARESIKYCTQCCALTEWETCQVCTDSKRVKSQICIVATQSELFSIRDAATEYRGLFHVLGGLISPLDGITPMDLSIETLLKRLRENVVNEVVFAFSPTPEGEVTISYIQRLIGDFKGVSTFKIASGIAVGSSLEFADRSTLLQAFMEKRLL